MFGAVAKALISGFDRSDSASAEFEAEYGVPLTLMTRVHMTRSVVLALLPKSGANLMLSNEFVEFGRVEVEHLDSGKKYLLRKWSRKPSVVLAEQQELFDEAEPVEYVNHVMLYGIDGAYLVISTGPVSIVESDSESPPRMVLRGALVEQGRWPLNGETPTPDPESSDGPSESTGFDQGSVDGFTDLGAIDLDLDDSQ